MTQQDLLDAGYRKCHITPKSELYKLADELYQKRIEENGVTLYFVNVYWYDWTEYSHQKPPSWAVETAMYPDENRVFGAEYHSDSRPIQEIESDIRGLYDYLKCIPDPHNQRE